MVEPINKDQPIYGLYETNNSFVLTPISKDLP